MKYLITLCFFSVFLLSCDHTSSVEDTSTTSVADTSSTSVVDTSSTSVETQNLKTSLERALAKVAYKI